MPPAHKPKWSPSEVQLSQIETLSGLGLTEEDISAFLGISKSTFVRAQKLKNSPLRDTLLKGRAKANAKVGESLFRMATSGKCPSATIFWMKVRMHWKETSQVEFPDKNGKPQEVGSQTLVILPAKEECK